MYFAVRAKEEKDGRIYLIRDWKNPSYFLNITAEQLEANNTKSNLESIFLSVGGDTQKPQFLVWEPLAGVSRIFSQNSIFVFSLYENLYESIFRKESIVIKSEVKNEIYNFLKNTFDLNDNTIFNDFVGFAQNNDSQMPISFDMGEDYFRLIQQADQFKLDNEYKKSESTYLKAIEIIEDLFGPNDQRLAKVYNKIVELYIILGKYKEALPYQEKAVSILEGVSDE